MNEQLRQTDLADEMAAAARRLADSTRSIRAVVSPSDSYALLGALRSTVADLGQVCQQLARWHDSAVEGVEYLGEDERGDGTGAATAAHELRQATAALDTAVARIAAAHSANGVVGGHRARATSGNRARGAGSDVGRRPGDSGAAVVGATFATHLPGDRAGRRCGLVVAAISVVGVMAGRTWAPGAWRR